MRYRTECAAPLAVIHQSHKRALKKGTRVEKVTHYWGRRYIPVQSNICNVKFDLGPTEECFHSKWTDKMNDSFPQVDNVVNKPQKHISAATHE